MTKDKINAILHGQDGFCTILARDHIKVDLVHLGTSCVIRRKARKSARMAANQYFRQVCRYDLSLPCNWLHMMQQFDLPTTGTTLVLNAAKRDWPTMQVLACYYTTTSRLADVHSQEVIVGHAVRAGDGIPWAFYQLNAEFSVQAHMERYRRLILG